MSHIFLLAGAVRCLRAPHDRPSLPSSRPSRIGSSPHSRGRPRTTSGRGRTCRLPRTTRTRSERPRIPPATSPCGSSPMPSRPPLRGGKGGLRFLHRLPPMLRGGQVPARASQPRRDARRAGAGGPRLRPVQGLPRRELSPRCRVGSDRGRSPPRGHRGRSAGGARQLRRSGAKILPKLSGLRVSESAAERTAERVGEDVGKRLNAGEAFGPKANGKWSADAEGQAAAYGRRAPRGRACKGPAGRRRRAGWRRWAWPGTAGKRVGCATCAGGPAG